MPDADASSGGAGRFARWRVPGLGVSLLRGAAAALVFGLAFPPVNAWPLVLLWPALVAHAAISARTRAAAFLGLWLSHAVAWFLLDTWLVNVAAAGWPFLALYMAAWPALVGLLVRAARPGGPLGGLPVALVLGVAWAGLEALRGAFLFDGYPWYLLAQPLIEMPMLVQSASWLGVYFVGFLVAVISGSAIDLRLALAARRAGGRMPRGRLVAAIGGPALAAGLVVHGAWRLAAIDENLRTVSGREARVVLVQTDLPQDNKIGWPLEDQIDAMRRWLALARDGADQSEAGGPGLPPRTPDLIVFPETMVPGFGFDPGVRATLERVGDVRAAFPGAIEQLAAGTGSTVLAGTMQIDGLEARRDERGIRYEFGTRTNAVVAVGPDGVVSRYDKRFLTPFGETMPWLSSWPWLERQLLALGAGGMSFDLEAGRGSRRLAIPTSAGGTWFIAAPICFEATVPALVHELMYRDRPPVPAPSAAVAAAGVGRVENPAYGIPSLIVSVSNDGWFGMSDAGRRRHAQMARFRAIEHRVPLVRAVNTGYSIVVDSGGRITARLGPGDYGTARNEAVLVADVPNEGRSTYLGPLTPYARIGPVWPGISLGLAAILAVAGAVRRPATGPRATNAKDG
jgi:apolipoprotein N-acyltransferase